MKRALLIAAAATALSGAIGIASSAKGLAYECAQLTNPTANQVWQTACNLPQDQVKP